MNEQERAALVEELAAIEHQRWSDWQAWCHSVLRSKCPSPELESILERWDRQIATPYDELTEREKQSDRDQVERYMPIIDRLLTQHTPVAEDAIQCGVKAVSKLDWNTGEVAFEPTAEDVVRAVLQSAAQGSDQHDTDDLNALLNSVGATDVVVGMVRPQMFDVDTEDFEPYFSCDIWTDKSKDQRNPNPLASGDGTTWYAAMADAIARAKEYTDD